MVLKKGDSFEPPWIRHSIDKELRLGRMLGPFDFTHDLPSLHVNRFGVIPKGHNTGKWRLITDLSFLERQSVNDGIDSSFCSLSYTTVSQCDRSLAILDNVCSSLNIAMAVHKREGPSKCLIILGIVPGMTMLGSN